MVVSMSEWEKALAHYRKQADEQRERAETYRRRALCLLKQRAELRGEVDHMGEYVDFEMDLHFEYEARAERLERAARNLLATLATYYDTDQLPTTVWQAEEQLREVIG